MIPLVMWKVLYIAICLKGIAAIFQLQAFRYHDAKGCRYFLYTLVALGFGWEAIDAGLYGPPGFPSSRWVLIPAAVGALTWTAFDAYRTRLKV